MKAQLLYRVSPSRSMKPKEMAAIMAAMLCGLSLFLTGAEERAIFMRVSASFAGVARLFGRAHLARQCARGWSRKLGGASEDARS